MRKYALLWMVLVVLLLAGCGGGSASSKGSKTGAAPPKKSGGAMNSEMFNFTIDSLNHLEQSQTYSAQESIKRQIGELRKAAAEQSPAQAESTLLSAWPESDSMRQIVDRLNQWIRAQPPPEWTLDPLLAELPESLQKLPIVAGLGKMVIGPFDGYYLQQAVYLRDVAHAARGKSIDERQRASRLFDWTVRNLQLESATPEHIPRFPWESLFFGQGTALERCWVFILLARQEGLEAAVLAIDKKNENSPAVSEAGSESKAPPPGDTLKPWCVAVRIEGKAYLFDLAYGLPIPGPNGLRQDEHGQLDVIPATLDELLADESLLARMNADADHPYPIAPSDLKRVVALVEASPTALSRRMKAVESHLQGKQKMVLTASAAEQAKRWKAMPGVAGVKLWQLPYETIRRRSELKPLEIAKQLSSFLPFYAMPSELLHAQEVVQNAAKTPKDMQDVYKGAAEEEGNKSPRNSLDSLQDTDSLKLKRQLDALNRFSANFTAPLYKGRVLQLKGQVSGDASENSAIKYYQMSCPSPQELRIIQQKLFSQIVSFYLMDKKNLSDEDKEKIVREIVEAIMGNKTLRNAENQRLAQSIRENDASFVDEQTTLILLGKMNASYWLGLVTFERGNYSSAFDYFGKYTLNAWPGGPCPWTAGAIYNCGRTREAEGEIDQAVKIYRSNAEAPDAVGQSLRAKWLQELKERKAEKVE